MHQCCCAPLAIDPQLWNNFRPIVGSHITGNAEEAAAVILLQPRHRAPSNSTAPTVLKINYLNTTINNRHSNQHAIANYDHNGGNDNFNYTTLRQKLEQQHKKQHFQQLSVPFTTWSLRQQQQNTASMNSKSSLFNSQYFIEQQFAMKSTNWTRVKYYDIYNNYCSVPVEVMLRQENLHLYSNMLFGAIQSPNSASTIEYFALLSKVTKLQQLQQQQQQVEVTIDMFTCTATRNNALELVHQDHQQQQTKALEYKLVYELKIPFQTSTSFPLVILTLMADAPSSVGVTGGMFLVISDVDNESTIIEIVYYDCTSKETRPIVSVNSIMKQLPIDIEQAIEGSRNQLVTNVKILTASVCNYMLYYLLLLQVVSTTTADSSTIQQTAIPKYYAFLCTFSAGTNNSTTYSLLQDFPFIPVDNDLENEYTYSIVSSRLILVESEVCPSDDTHLYMIVYENEHENKFRAQLLYQCSNGSSSKFSDVSIQCNS